MDQECFILIKCIKSLGTVVSLWWAPMVPAPPPSSPSSTHCTHATTLIPDHTTLTFSVNCGFRTHFSLLPSNPSPIKMGRRKLLCFLKEKHCYWSKDGWRVPCFIHSLIPTRNRNSFVTLGKALQQARNYRAKLRPRGGHGIIWEAGKGVTNYPSGRFWAVGVVG